MDIQTVLNSLKDELEEVKVYIQLTREDDIQLKEYQLRTKELENEIKNITGKFKNKKDLTQEKQVGLTNEKIIELHVKHRKSNKRYKIARKQRADFGIYTRKRKQLLKRISNKRVRVARGSSNKSNLYRKVFDLEWELD